MRRVWAWTLRSMTSSPRSRVGSSTFSLRRMRVQPRIAVSGVRSSWDSVARNSSLARFATSASARAPSAWRYSSALSMARASACSRARIWPRVMENRSSATARPPMSTTGTKRQAASRGKLGPLRNWMVHTLPAMSKVVWELNSRSVMGRRLGSGRESAGATPPDRCMSASSRDLPAVVDLHLDVARRLAAEDPPHEVVGGERRVDEPLQRGAPLLDGLRDAPAGVDRHEDQEAGPRRGVQLLGEGDLAGGFGEAGVAGALHGRAAHGIRGHVEAEGGAVLLARGARGRGSRASRARGDRASSRNPGKPWARMRAGSPAISSGRMRLENPMPCRVPDSGASAPGDRRRRGTARRSTSDTAAKRPLVARRRAMYPSTRSRMARGPAGRRPRSGAGRASRADSAT